MDMRGFCMKRLLGILGSVILVLGLGGCASMGGGGSLLKPKLSNHDLIAQEGGSTVALIMYHDDKETTVTTGYRPFCTGVWVDDTHILTADHCAKAEQEHQQDRLDERKKAEEEANKNADPFLQMLRKLFGGASGPQEVDKIEEKGLVIHYIVENEVLEVGKEPTAWHMSKVVGYDEKHDLALLEVVGKAVPGHKVAKLASATPEIGEDVHIVGQTVGMYWTYIKGSVSAYRGEDYIKNKGSGGDLGPWMQVASPMYFGNSGGGAFNDYGELVGIADWIKRAPEMGFFVHLDTIRSFLKDQSLLAQDGTTLSKVVGKVVLAEKKAETK